MSQFVCVCVCVYNVKFSFPLENSDQCRKSVHCLFQLPWLLASLGLWPHHSKLCFCDHIASSSSLCVYFIMVWQSVDLGITQISQDHFLISGFWLSYICKDFFFFSNKVIFTGSRDLDIVSSFGGHQGPTSDLSSMRVSSPLGRETTVQGVWWAGNLFFMVTLSAVSGFFSINMYYLFSQTSNNQQ